MLLQIQSRSINYIACLVEQKPRESKISRHHADVVSNKHKQVEEVIAALLQQEQQDVGLYKT